MNFARTLAAALFATCLLATGAAWAQTYPNRTITLLVPYPPGGATDTIARILQNPLQNALGQTIVIENVGGAGGMIAADKAARANPDGYTFLIHQVALAAGMALYQNLNFDAEKNFVTIGLINTAASTLAGRPDLPTMGELGSKKLAIDFWHMLLAPTGTPRPIIDKLNVALRAALADARVQKTFADGGMEEFPAADETPEAAAALLSREIKLWGGVIRDNHIAAQ